MDVTYVHIPGYGWWYAVTVIDYYSRSLLAARLTWRHQRLGRREKLVRACHRRLAAQESTARTPPAGPQRPTRFCTAIARRA